MNGARLVLTLSTIEVAQLHALVTQFAELVEDSASPDPDLDRLAPDAYPDDPGAGAEFRRLTRGDILERRASEAGVVLTTLDPAGDLPSIDDLDDDSAALPRILTLDVDETGPWMRTLNALRLVLAERLGIVEEADAPVDDPRYVLYEWVGMVLDALVRALDET